MNDAELLERFRESRDEQAFATVVNRHVALVYSAAMRQLRDRHLAEDATQAAFVTLVKKLRTLRVQGSIAGWLIATTRFIALDLQKGERRRRHRETVIAKEQPMTTNEPPGQENEITPLLDEGLSRLSDP